MRKIIILASLILSFTAAQGHAQGFSLLAGLQTVSFGGDLSKYYNISSGVGMAVTAGLPSILGLPFDLTLGQREMKERSSGEDAKYRWIELGPRIQFGHEEDRIRPEVTAGGGVYNFELGNKNFDSATGFYAGIGFEDNATERISGRFQIKTVYWKSDTGQTDAPSLNFVLMYGYKF